MPKSLERTEQLAALLVSNRTDSATAFALFDQLEPVSLDEMLGQWQGIGCLLLEVPI